MFLPGEFHGQRSLEGYSPWDCRVEHNWAQHTATVIWFTSNWIEWLLERSLKSQVPLFLPDSFILISTQEGPGWRRGVAHTVPHRSLPPESFRESSEWRPCPQPEPIRPVLFPSRFKVVPLPLLGPREVPPAPTCHGISSLNQPGGLTFTMDRPPLRTFSGTSTITQASMHGARVTRYPFPCVLRVLTPPVWGGRAS